MGPLSKLWFGVDKVNCSGKSGRMSLEDLSTSIEKTVVLVGQASQSMIYQRTDLTPTRSLKIDIYPKGRVRFTCLKEQQIIWPRIWRTFPQDRVKNVI